MTVLLTVTKRYSLTGGASVRTPKRNGPDVVIFHLLANVVLVLHLLFIVWAVGGGLLLLAGWNRVAWLHLPAALWAIGIEFGGWICPLTPLEWRLRARAGEAGLSGGFVERYLTAWIYPDGLTRNIQITIGVAILVFNIAIYAYWLTRVRPKSRRASSGKRPGR